MSDHQAGKVVWSTSEAAAQVCLGVSKGDGPVFLHMNNSVSCVETCTEHLKTARNMPRLSDFLAHSPPVHGALGGVPTAAGANVVVAGSALFGAADPGAVMPQLRAALDAAATGHK